MSSHFTRQKRKYARRLGAVSLGVGLLAAPAMSAAQSQKAPAAAPALPPPPPPPAAPQAAPPPGMPPPGVQPGQPPYPYPYPYPYGQPGYPYPPPPPGYGYPPAGVETQELKPVMPYKGGVVPPGYVLEERVRKGLVIAGSVLFGTFYLFTAAGAAAAESNSAPWGALYVPVIGPFIVAGAGNFRGDAEVVRPLFVLDGIIQAGGAAMLIAGIVAKQKVLVREDLVARTELLVGPGSVGMKMSF
ncbi:hypothetical protein [Polyangium sp. 6x1]|uniref:hypothetical protein n=1 Tax=Polyangium sp. 6x1 TaxID=3042689 RepID=UPI002482BAFF|nr:hypothetical protein [Polyangium sp. 6x1]MDI1442792.1 hypothetical protein [Polyangium sp. 6x1]